MRSVSDGAGQLADAHLFCRHFEALDVPLYLGIPIGQLQAEGNRLGMDAMRPADGGRVLKLPGTPLQDLAQLLQIVANDRRRLLYQQRLRGIDDVVRSQAVVQPARLRADLLRDCRSKGDDVVLHLGFDLMDPSDLEATLFANGLGRALRYDAGFRQSFGG